MRDMKVEIQVDGLRATIQEGKWQGDPALLPRVLEADTKAGFVWDPVGGQDYARAKAVAHALGGVALTPLPQDKNAGHDDESVIF
jgi:hypothetical protein